MGGSKVDCIPSENEVESSNPGVFSFFFICTVFFSTLFVRHRVCGFTTEYLDLIDCNYTTELYAAVRRTSVYSYLPAMYFWCFCSVRVFAILLLLMQLLLHAAAVRHRVPDGKVCWCGSLHLIPVSSSSFKHNLLLMYVPLGSTAAVAFAALIYVWYVLHILGNYGHARSQDGRHPAAA